MRGLFHIDYVVGLHNIHVIHVLNYRLNVIDFLCVQNTINCFSAHFQYHYQTQKNKSFSKEKTVTSYCLNIDNMIRIPTSKAKKRITSSNLFVNFI